jgi:hypothetical protein
MSRLAETKIGDAIKLGFHTVFVKAIKPIAKWQKILLFFGIESIRIITTPVIYPKKDWDREAKAINYSIERG